MYSLFHVSTSELRSHQIELHTHSPRHAHLTFCTVQTMALWKLDPVEKLPNNFENALYSYT